MPPMKDGDKDKRNDRAGEIDFNLSGDFFREETEVVLVLKHGAVERRRRRRRRGGGKGGGRRGTLFRSVWCLVFGVGFLFRERGDPIMYSEYVRLSGREHNNTRTHNTTITRTRTASQTDKRCWGWRR